MITLRKLRKISPSLMLATIAFSAVAAMARSGTQTSIAAPVPTLMPESTPSISPMPMPTMPMPSMPTMPSTPMPAETPTVTPTPGAESAAPKTIVDIASEAGTFKTLVAALKAADLVETLSSPGPFTVFAPTDEAFAALPKGTVEKLLLPKNKAALAKVLTYHVVSGAAESSMLKAGTIKTVEGSSVTVKTMMGHVMVDSAMVTTADVRASNGIIHVIDKVLLPADVKL